MEDLPIKVMVFLLDKDTNMDRFVEDRCFDLRIDEAAIFVIKYPSGNTHRWYAWRAEKKIIWTEKLS